MAGVGGEALFTTKEHEENLEGEHILYFDCDGGYMSVFVETHRIVHSKRQILMCV